jgi:hypothetical protein
MINKNADFCSVTPCSSWKAEFSFPLAFPCFFPDLHFHPVDGANMLLRTSGRLRTAWRHCNTDGCTHHLFGLPDGKVLIWTVSSLSYEDFSSCTLAPSGVVLGTWIWNWKSGSDLIEVLSLLFTWGFECPASPHCKFWTSLPNFKPDTCNVQVWSLQVGSCKC